MEQQTDVRALLDQADTLLREERVAEAAAEFARAVQLEPAAVGGHLGLAEANLALGQYGIAAQACQHVRQLAPSSADAALADAILAVLERRYDAALDALEREVDLDPARAYAHALRAYVLRRLGRNYDAALAEARAARLTGKRDWDNLFPPVTKDAAPASFSAPAPTDLPPSAAPPTTDRYGGTPHRIQYAPQRTWNRSNRVATRTRLLFATQPVVTYTLIALNVVVFAVGFFGLQDQLFVWGAQIDALILANPLQAYRFVTAMFLHDGLLHIGLNMLSLFFVGIITERLFGAWRFTLIYFASGILGGLTQFGYDVLILHHPDAAVGASGAIFGIFGAFGSFLWLRRRQLGPAANGIIGQWLFWLALNLVFSFAPGFSIGGATIAGFDHLGGLAAGLILGALLVPPLRRRI
jgi:rhomboid protease GluP